MKEYYCPACGARVKHTKFPCGNGYACNMSCVMKCSKIVPKKTKAPIVVESKSTPITYDLALKETKRRVNRLKKEAEVETISEDKAEITE